MSGFLSKKGLLWALGLADFGFPVATTLLGEGMDARVYLTTDPEVVLRVGPIATAHSEEDLLDEDFSEGVVKVLGIRYMDLFVLTWKERLDMGVESFIRSRHNDRDAQEILRSLLGMYDISEKKLSALSRFSETKGLASAIRNGLPTSDLDLSFNIGVTLDGRVVAFDL